MTTPRTVLLADDDRSIRTVLTQALTRAGYRVRATASTATLWRWVQEGEGDLALTDVVMPDGDGLDLLPAIRRRRPELPVIVMSAQNTVTTAIRSAEAGAYEYMPKPFDLKELLTRIRAAIEARGPAGPAAGQGARPEEQSPLIGRSAAMQDVYRAMARLMNTDLTVMITGESGSGKEVVARALHGFGRRKSGPFVAINLAATPRDQVERTLFGDERAAGRFQQARGGTLFLDEIGDMPPEAQARLLWTLQDGALAAPGGGGGAPIRVEARIIAATRHDLRALIAEGRFREDLFYRLNVVPIHLPPLRQRVEDIPDLARAFLRRARKEGLPAKSFAPSALEALRRRDWPGNVRELENVVRRLCALCAEDVIEGDAVARALEDRPEAAAPEASATLSAAVEAHLKRYFALHGDQLPPEGLYDRVIREVELPLIALTLAATRGNQLRAGKVLGINRNTLRKRIQDLDIMVTRGKKLM